MSHHTAGSQEETTPLLSQQDSTVQEEPRWSLARRRSSAFLSFLSEPEDKTSDEYSKYHRRRAVYLIVFLYMVFNISLGIGQSFMVELVQTLACAEYYYASSSGDPRFPTLPSAGDPLELCSVLWIDKRTSQIYTYASVFASASSCIVSLLLAKSLLPHFRPRTLAMASVVVTVTVTAVQAMIPTHYSFDPAVASSSTMHPTTALNLLLAVTVMGNLVGADQSALPLIMQAMVLDVVREDERTSGLSQIFAGLAIGLSFSSVVLGLVLPYFDVHFSILRHSGPFSPFWLCVIVLVITLILMYLWLPETRSFAKHISGSRRSSVSSQDRFYPDDASAEIRTPSAASPSSPSTLPKPWTSSILHAIKDTLSLFGYLLPYQPHPGAPRDYKLPLMLCGVIFSDNITMVWSNLLVFCSTHLHLGPEGTTKLLGILGATKGICGLLVLPWVVQLVRRAVTKRLRRQLLSVTTDGLAQEDQMAKREKSAIYTDKIIALVSLGFDCAGFVVMGVAAAHLSTDGIYGSLFLLMFACGAIPAIQALSVDLFEAQNRPTDDPIAARDAFLGFLNLLLNVLVIVAPLLNNAIYRWSIDHSLPALVFFWTAFTTFIAILFIASAALLAR